MGIVARAVDKLLEASVVGSFSRVGIAVRRAGYAPFDVDLRGRVVVLTGAGSGLGRSAAKTLQGLGATLVLPVRDVDRAAAAFDDTTNLTLVRADLADLDAVRALGAELRRAHPRIHALVNNAGVLPLARARTPQGLELAFATNVLAGFALTDALRENLQAGGTVERPARLVTMSSGGMYTQRLRLPLLQDQDTEKPYDGVVAYAQTKRAQVVLNALWAAELGPTVACAALHPGWAQTPGVATSLPTFNRVMGPLLRTPADGADTMVWLVASTEPLPHLRAGRRFFHDRAARAEHLRAGTQEDEATRRALWDLCVRLTAP